MEAVEIRKLTVAEFHQMEFDDDDNYLYELLDGELVKKKAPTPAINYYWLNYMIK